MANEQFTIRNDNNRFNDCNYEKSLVENVKNKISSVTDKNKIGSLTDENRTRIEMTFSLATNIDISDMRGSAKIYTLEKLYNEVGKYSQ